jgi:putative aldouronate transport system permease protein
VVTVRHPASDRLFVSSVYAALALGALAVVFPFLYVLAVSVTPFEEVLKHGGFILLPRKITLDAYVQFLTRSTIPRAYAVTVSLTVAGTAVNLLLTTLIAYPLSRRTLPGRSLLLMFILIPMVFGGGIIPTYIIVRSLGLLDSYLALILPGAVWTFNAIIMKTFFERMEPGLLEAATIDGAGELTILFRIVLPLSLPVMSTVGLYYAVAHWNQFFAAIMYLSTRSKYPLQPILREIITGAESVAVDHADFSVPPDTLKMAAVMLTAVPVMLVYPFLQKHFTQGVLLGSIKG